MLYINISKIRQTDITLWQKMYKKGDIFKKFGEGGRVDAMSGCKMCK